MFKTVDKDRFITLMALVVVLSALLGLWVEALTSTNHANEITVTTIWSGVEHGALGLTIFFFVFSKFLWKWRLFHWLGIVKYPNLSGEWTGTGKSDTLGPEYTMLCTITQNAWTIVWKCAVQGEPERVTSRNKSIAVEFTKDDAGSLYLNVIYRNDIELSDPAKHGVDHYGACRLEVIEGSNSKQGLHGRYWTNKKTGGYTCTSGRFLLEKVSRGENV